MKDWWVCSNVVAVESADRAAQGKHYCDSPQLYKLYFEALLRFRIMEFLKNLTLDDTFTALIGKLRVDSSPNISRVS